MPEKPICQDCEAIGGKECPEVKCFTHWLEDNGMTKGFEWVMREIKKPGGETDGQRI